MGASSLLEFYHRHPGELAAVAMTCCATFSVMAWTSTARRIGVMAVGALRLAAASLILACWGWLARGLWIPTDVGRQAWAILAISGVLGYFVCDILVIKSFLVIGPRLTLLLQSITPVLVAILGYYYFEESLGAVNLLGMAVTLAGIVWVILERPESPKEIHHRKDFSSGVVMAIAAAVIGGLSTLLAKKGIGPGDDPLAATQIRILAALLCYPPMLTLLRRWGQIGRGLRHAEAMKILLFGTVLGPVLGMSLFMYALQVCPSTGVVTTIASATPVLIMPLSISIYKEKVSPRAALGAMVSVVGVMLMMY
ncbi:MAG: DMT family transporter [Pirellulales bacterium]|nr:DMT family transporter [Pirellulales bacterium]